MTLIKLYFLLLFITYLFYFCYIEEIQTKYNVNFFYLMTYSYISNFLKTQYSDMYKLWKDIYIHNLSRYEIILLFHKLFPYSIMKQKVFFFDPNVQVDSFPFSRMPYEKEIQKLIFLNQYPKKCNDKSFIVLHNFSKSPSGFGSISNIISGYFALGLDSNRTVIYYPNDYYKLSTSNKCKKPGLDCFFLPISSCNFSKKEIDSDPYKFQKYPINDWSRYYKYPRSIISIISKTATPQSLYYFYWRIQVKHFILRLNKDMEKWINNFRNEALINPKEFYDVSIFIRHGDKSREMKLIPTNEYMYPLEILSRLLNRKISVLVSSDSSLSINYFSNLNSSKFEFSYFKYERPLKGHYFTNVKDIFNNSIQSFSDLFESIKANYLIGTLQSQWCKLILEMKLFSNFNMNLPYFEIGQIKCITPIHCRYLKKKLKF